MPVTQADLDSVSTKRQQAQNLIRQSGDLTAGSNTFKDEVMAKVRENRASRGISNLTQDIADTRGQIISAPADIRARTADVNPLQVDALTARQRGQTLSTLSAQNDFETSINSGIDEIIGAGANVLVSAAAKKKAEADAANQEANALMEQLQYKLQERKQAFDEWATSQSIGLANAKFAADQGDQQALDLISQARSMPTAGERSQASNTLETLQDLYNVQDMMSKGGNITGPVVGRYSNIKTNWFNQPANTTVKLDESLKKLFDTARVESTGAAFSEDELKQLGKYVARGSNVQEAKINSTIDSMERKLVSQMFSLGMKPYFYDNSGTLVEPLDVKEYYDLKNSGEYKILYNQ